MVEMNKPVIGIILDYSNKKIKQGGYANYPWYALRTHYSDAIARLGGVPIFLPHNHKCISQYLKICNGLLFAGGDIDIHPSLYGEEVSVKNINLDQDSTRIEFEFAILKEALKGTIPIVAICAGFQLLNVALGGSLFQDIVEQVKTNITHIASSDSVSKNSHPITVVEESKLHKIVENNSYVVNSFHHQTVKKVGDSLTVSAIAPDGLVEGVELEDHPFCIGVEWHPEFQEIEEDIKLFKAFIRAAQDYSKK